jgi:hypothetical protein
MTASTPEIVAEYLRLRKVAERLNHRLVETLPKDVLDEGGKKLGILKGNTLVLDSEDQIAVLMDFCIYNVRRGGQNAVERYVANSPPTPGSDEALILEAMQRAWYSLFQVQSAVPGSGVAALDVLREREVFITDVSMSRSGVRGLVLASRLIPFDAFTMTGGAGLPVPSADALDVLQARAEQVVRKLGIKNLAWLTSEQDTELTAAIVRACLETGGGSHIAYGQPGAPAPARATPPAPTRRMQSGRRGIGRNDRCPCGSGRKFKNCCGARH